MALGRLLPAMTSLALLMTSSYAAPPRYEQGFARICEQGDKVFNLVALRGFAPTATKEQHFVLPRCLPLEPRHCTVGCEWIVNRLPDNTYASCERHPAYGQKGEHVYLAGIEVFQGDFGEYSVASYCCESLRWKWSDEGCRQQWVPVTTFSWPLALQDEIVRQVAVVFDGLTDSLQATVCHVNANRTEGGSCDRELGFVDYY